MKGHPMIKLTKLFVTSVHLTKTKREIETKWGVRPVPRFQREIPMTDNEDHQSGETGRVRSELPMQQYGNGACQKVRWCREVSAYLERFDKRVSCSSILEQRRASFIQSIPPSFECWLDSLIVQVVRHQIKPQGRRQMQGIFLVAERVLNGC
jgi:hypothetical protein